MLTQMAAAKTCRPEQWQAQIQAIIQRRHPVLLYSALPEEAVRAAHLVPCRDIGAAVNQWLQGEKNGKRVGVLPQGPLTIPYLAG
jgi:nickel-dependent lactate racemase